MKEIHHMKIYSISSWFQKRLPTAVLAVLLLIPASAMAASVYIPHITGTGGVWRDFLQVDNPTQMEAFFTVTIYDNGADVFTETYSVEALGERVIDLKTLAASFNSATGIVQYDDSFQLNIRLSYENKSAGGVAEFRLDNFVGNPIGFFFSGFTPAVTWKAISITNWGGSEEITLFALGDSGVLGIEKIMVRQGRKVVGVHTEWFPTVDQSDIKKIIAVSEGTAMNGVTIAGDDANSFLLFTPAAAVGSFYVHAGDWIGNLQPEGSSPRNLSFYLDQTGEEITGTMDVLDLECGNVTGVSVSGMVGGTIEGSYSCDGGIKRLEFYDIEFNYNQMYGDYTEYYNGGQWSQGEFDVRR
jgi:hypothetical protein